MEMGDPLGKPVLPTGPEYMEGLAKLGYNVETMNSLLPTYTKAANAATSFMDQAFNQRLAWDKAQADNKEMIARANQADSITNYNNATSDLRIKALQQEADQRDLDLEYNRHTQAGKEEAFDLQRQLQKQNFDIDNATFEGRKTLAVEQGKYQLAETQQKSQDLQSALADRPAAIDELRQIQPNAPDFDQQIAQWHTRHLTAINNPATATQIANELDNVTKQRTQLIGVQRTAANRAELARLAKDNHLPYNMDLDSPAFINDPQKVQQALVQGHMSEEVDNLNGLYTAITASGVKLPAQQAQEWENLRGVRDRLVKTQNLDGYMDLINGGNGNGDILGPDGYLRKDVKVLAQDIQAFLQRQAQLKAPEAKVTIGKPLSTGPEVELQNVPIGQVNQYLAGIEGTGEQQQTLQLPTQDFVNAHPEIRPFVRAYIDDKSDANKAALSDAIQKAQGQRSATGHGYQYGGRVGYQSGGQVGGESIPQFLGSPGDSSFLGRSTTDTVSTDTVPAMLTPGEFVLNKAATTAIGPENLDAMNKTGQKPADTAVAAFSGLTQQQQNPDQIPKQPVAAVPTPTPESDTGRIKGSNVNNYSYPEGAGDLNGIDRNVWTNVMGEEGPAFGMDGKHMSVFGLWKDAPGAEGEAFKTVKEHGANSLPAYQAVTNAWDKLFLQQTKPQLLKSPGMQEMVIADSQHVGGKSTLQLIQEMGGWEAINKMNPADAIRTYSALRAKLWPGNSARVDREREWALKNDSILSGQPQQQTAGMQSGGLVEGNPLYGPGLGFQHGGFVSGGGAGGGFESELEGGGGGGGFEAGLDQTGGGAEGQRHRRFHPRGAGMGGMGAQPNIPDPMQKKLHKLSQDFIGGLSSLIRSKPELGGEIMRHAKNLIAQTGLSDVRTGEGESTFGGGERQQPMGMNPAMLAMSGMGGEQGSSSEDAYT